MYYRLLFNYQLFSFSIKSSAVTGFYCCTTSGYAIFGSSISGISSSELFSLSFKSLEYFSLKILIKVEDTSSVPKNAYTHVVNVGDNST